MGRARKKLYVVGIDSAPLWMIDGLSRKYGMRGFRQFIDGDSLVEMKSTLPPVSSPAWASIYSGLEPREHEVMDFLHLDRNYTKQLIYYDSKRSPTFWSSLAKRGLKCLMITPPMILTKERVKGLDLVTGWPLAPSYSSEELERDAKRFAFEGEPHFGSDFEEGKLSLRQMSDRYVESIVRRARFAEHLIRKKEYDFVFVCFTETDRMQHFAFKEKGRGWEKYIAPIYNEISLFIEHIMEISKEKKEEASFVLLSDHGTQIIQREFLVNAWLVNEGYAALKEKVYDRYTKNLQEAGSKGFDTKRFLINKALKVPYRRKVYSMMPGSIKKMADDVLERGTDQKRSDKRYMKILEADFQMAKTEAFASISYGPIGMIWINDSRFAHPGVRDTKRAREDIVEGLKKLKSEDGKRLVTSIVDGREYYRGAGSFIAPDIIVELREGYVIDFSYYSKGELFMDPEPARTGDHSMYGVFGVISVGGKKPRKPLSKGMQITEVKKFITDYFKG